MGITVECPHCGRHHKLGADAAGAIRRCDCGQSYRVPGDKPATPAVPKPDPRLFVAARKLVLAVVVAVFLVWLATGLRDVLTVHLSDADSPVPEELLRPFVTDVDKLVATLSSDDRERARSAAVKLGREGEPALSRVLTVFRGEDEDAVFAAGIALAGIGRPAVPHLIAALQGDDVNVVAVVAAARALNTIGKEDATAIVAAFDPLLVAVRRHAVAARSTPRVVSSDDGVSEHDRRNAATARIENEANAAAAGLGALGTLSDTRALGTIIRGLDHPHRTVAYAAAEAIKTFGPAAVAPLIAAWRRGEAHNNWGIRALWLTGDPQAVDPLIEALEMPKLAWRAAAALGRMGDQRAAEPLLALLQADTADKPGRAWAADSLGKLNYAPAVPALVAGLADPEEFLQRASAEALGAIGDESAVTPLIFALEREAPRTVTAAATSLGQLGDSRACEPLIALLDHGEQSVRVAAIRALETLKDPRAIEPLIGVMLANSGADNSAAHYALKEIGTPAAPALVQALATDDRRARSDIMQLLRSMGEDAMSALIAELEAPDCSTQKELISLLRSLTYNHPRAQEAITAANGN